MGSHNEDLTIEAGAELYGPLDEIGDDVVPPGHYAIGFSNGSGGSFLVGTPEQIYGIAERISDLAGIMRRDFEKPLTFLDFGWDSDESAFICPRCADAFEPLSSMDNLATRVQAHIDEDHSAASDDAPE